MTISTGTKLAHYEIISQIGKGGMGEVYQGKDTKLGREVAIKVLPEEFALDPDRVTRFQREAKLLASLNHPNIATIHGLEESEGATFLVMELVEGETLAGRLKSGPIPVEDALKLALQISEALEAAHEKGIIHRDLKPANIKITPDGKVKVLDFGLAKAFAGERAEMVLSDSPTISVAATQIGVILGTAAYMSPEQAKGKTVDKRADIWAFGAVFFEMLTGKPAFEGDEVSEILASVIKADSNLDLLPENIHPRIRETLNRCLQKDLRKRYPDIANARYEIEQVLADPSGVFIKSVSSTEPRRPLKKMLPWLSAAFVIGVILTGIIVWNLRIPEPRQVMRFHYELPQNQTFSHLIERNLAVSPDGKYFVYGTRSGLYRRPVDELDAKLIPGTEGNAQQPFFSPDGKWIGYWSPTDGKMMKVSVGGAPVPICDVETFLGASWGEDNMIIFGERGHGIMQVSGNGGIPELLAKGDSQELKLPQILPDGETVLLARGDIQEKVTILSLKTRQFEELFNGDAPYYLPTGHITYLDDQGRIAARQFDLDTLKTIGGEVPVSEAVYGPGGGTQYAISNSGTLAYIPFTASVTPKSTLVWVDRRGKEEALDVDPNSYSEPRISPDGKRVALTIENYANAIDIWILDLFDNNLTIFTLDSEFDGFPLWSLDNQRIVFVSTREGGFVPYWKNANGTGKAERLSSSLDRIMVPCSWAENGKTLIVEGSGNIGMLQIEGTQNWKPLLAERYDEIRPQISPDGKWLAYMSNESGQYEIYVCPFPDADSGGKWKVSTSGGDSPLWSHDGTELFYRSGDSFMAVNVVTDPTFDHGKAIELFKRTYASDRSGVYWDIHPNTKRFLMLKPTDDIDGESMSGVPRRINVVINWFEELKQRVPVD